MNKKDFSSEELFTFLSDLPQTKHYFIAYSGGVDSSVLLHVLNQLKTKLEPAKITALHVNHGIVDEADLWEKHCRKKCMDLNIEFINIKINARPIKGESPEALARELRYKALKKYICKNDIILTGHHNDDQAETLLLQLFRGAGVRGLASMGTVKIFGEGILARPLLSYSREQIRKYAEQEKLEWIEDKSNKEIKYDRNFIRKHILPTILKRWPAASQTIARSANHQAEMAMLLDELAHEDYQKLFVSAGNSLNLEQLKLLSEIRIKNLLLYWLKKIDMPVPGSTVIQNIVNELIMAGQDRSPCVAWDNVEIRRYRDRLFAMSTLPDHNPDAIITWDISKPLDLPVGVLKAIKNKGKGIHPKLIQNKKLYIKYRTGGEQIQPPSKPYHCELKKLFQEKGIPPWERNRIPLIYMEDKLIAVADMWVAKEFSTPADEEGWAIALVKK